jgi:two-component system cell cycle sensor histidine kinase/response regulator CckA
MQSILVLALMALGMVGAAAVTCAWWAHRAQQAARETPRAPAATDARGSAPDPLIPVCSADLAVVVGEDGRILCSSPPARRTFGVRFDAEPGELLVDRIVEADRSRADELMRRARLEGAARGTLHATLPNGEVRAYDTHVDATQGVAPGALVVSGRDTTEQLRLSDQLRQAQKVEALGRLAAGVAHDFNNLLAVIQSGAALAVEHLPSGHPAQDDLADVAAAARRGAALSRQLLAFARKDPARAPRADVGSVLAEMARFVPRLVGRGVQVRFAEGSTLGEVGVSPTSLEQVILNLAINARDAMPKGGWITIEAQRVEVRSGDGSSLSPGPHVEISVQDQGTGMSEEVRRRLFEPFFTTKDPDAGSGLGLATSRDIVEGAGGTIEVDTEEGRGSVFRVLLPRLALAPGLEGIAPPEIPTVRRSRVLIVDHDPELVALLSRLLAARGHEVITAATATEARQQAASFPGAVDVVLTGIDLGEDHGAAVLGEVRRTSPRARVVLLAGDLHAASDVDHLVSDDVAFVKRPVPVATLVDLVERAVEKQPARRQPAMA